MLNPDFWPLWTYLLGYVWFWRYHVGYVLDDFVYGSEPDGIEVILSVAIGTIGCVFWPFTVTCRGVVVLWTKYGSDRTQAIGGFFPAPKEIESSGERKQRLEREERDKARARQREINAKERELGMKLTDW